MSHVLPSLVELLGAAVPDPGNVPNPGNGSEPPGFAKITTIMSWVKYLSLGVLVVGLMIGGARLAFGFGRGGGQEEGAAIGKVLVGVLVVASSFTLVSTLAGG